MLLPRNEYIVEPPMHSMDHGRVEVVKGEEKDGGGGKKERRRSSLANLFRKEKEGKGEAGHGHGEIGLENEVKGDVDR